MHLNPDLLNALKKQVHNNNLPISKKTLQESTSKLISFVELLIKADQANTTNAKKSI